MRCCIPGGHSGAGWLDESMSRAYRGGAVGHEAGQVWSQGKTVGSG